MLMIVWVRHLDRAAWGCLVSVPPRLGHQLKDSKARGWNHLKAHLLIGWLIVAGGPIGALLSVSGFCAWCSLKFKYGGWVPRMGVPGVREPSRSCTLFMAEPWRSHSISPAMFFWLVRHKPPPTFNRWEQGPPTLSGKSVHPV